MKPLHCRQKELVLGSEITDTLREQLSGRLGLVFSQQNEWKKMPNLAFDK